MRALTWHGKNDIRYYTVPDPKIQDRRVAIIKVTACAICGLDLHLFDGVMPSMEKGDLLGHETMGEVVEVGSKNKKLRVGDRVVVPFTISCGECFFCRKGFFCERSKPNHKMAEKLWGHSPRVSSVILICRAVTPAAKRSISACRMPRPAPSRCWMVSSTNRCCSSPTFSERLHGCRFLRSQMAAKPSRFGVAAPSAS
jgi:hypothetical protein